MNRILLAVVLVGTVAGSAWAGSNPQTQLAVDLRAKIMGLTGCSGASFPTYPSCAEITQSAGWDPAGEDIFVVVYNFSAIQGIEFGMQWGSTPSGTYLYPSWTRCATIDVWTNTATSFSEVAAWSTCQPSAGGTSGMVVVWGVTGPSRAGAVHLDLGPSAQGRELVVDCDLVRDDLHLLHDGYLNEPAPPPPQEYPPCVEDPTATERSSWSGVKALYK